MCLVWHIETPILQILVIATLAILVGCGREATPASSGQGVDANALALEAKQFAQAWNLSPYDPLLESHPRSASFDKYFEPIGILEIPDSILVASITSLNVSSTGDLVLVDRRSEQVILVKADSHSFSRLSTEPCDPGYAFQPMEAVFTPNGDILVASNTRPSGFFFRSTGACIESIDFGTVPHGLAALRDQVIVYKARRDSQRIYSVDRSGTQHTIAQWKPFAIINSRVHGLRNLVAVDSERVAIVQIQSPAADVVSTTTGEVIQVGRQPDYYRGIRSEVSESVIETAAVFDEIRRNTEGRSRSIGVFSLSKELLALVYRNGYAPFQTSPRGVGIQIVSTTGLPVHTEPILLRGYQFGIIGAARGFLFVTGTYDLDSHDSNRPIVVYRFRSERIEL